MARVLVPLLCLVLAACASAGPSRACLPAGDAGIVLLGEQHDRADHHRWQADTIARLHDRNPDLAVGLEMLPRRAQPALDRYVAGATDEAGFLAESEWPEAWGFDFALYRPIFQVARERGIPLVALNVDRALVGRVGEEGWDAVAAREVMPVGRPAPPLPGYLDRLAEAYAGHGGSRGDPGFRNFVDAQQLWDRVMAEALLAARRDHAMVVGVMGAGHMRDGHGVPRQLAAMGAGDVTVLLPPGLGEGCVPPAGRVEALAR